jgi:sigma-B regulation protein RsbU (phosphoserine phosphatase)
VVLVVDDNGKNLDICRINLEMEDMEVHTAVNGAEGLEKSRRVKPDLILLDIMMPVMDGYEMLKRLKSTADLSDIPVLMLTAKAAVNEVVKALDMGAQDYLRKPFDVEELVARSRTLISLKKAQETVRENQRRLSMELALAASIQENLLPSTDFLNSISKDGLSVYAFTQPASEVNGDMFDIRRLGDGILAAALVDCKGHGVSAGMMTMAVHAIMDAVVPVLPGAAEVMRHLDRRLRSMGPAGEFVGVVYLQYELATGQTLISRAGMPFPVHFRRQASQVEEISVNGGPPLGLPAFEGEFHQVELTLEKGDKLVLFSDGLTEAADESGQLFGAPLTSLLRCIRQFGSTPASEMGPGLIEDWRTFTNDRVEDDCSLLILERL